MQQILNKVLAELGPVQSQLSFFLCVENHQKQMQQRGAVVPSLFLLHAFNFPALHVSAASYCVGQFEPKESWQNEGKKEEERANKNHPVYSPGGSPCIFSQHLMCQYTDHKGLFVTRVDRC